MSNSFIDNNKPCYIDKSMAELMELLNAGILCVACCLEFWFFPGAPNPTALGFVGISEPCQGFTWHIATTSSFYPQHVTSSSKRPRVNSKSSFFHCNAPSWSSYGHLMYLNSTFLLCWQRELDQSHSFQRINYGISPEVSPVIDNIERSCNEYFTMSLSNRCRF